MRQLTMLNSYGTLLGSEVFQTFVGGIVAYKALSRPQFSVLQQKIFPVYFGMQTLLPVLMALTYPYATSTSLNFTQSLGSILEPTNRSEGFIPIAVMAVCGALNWAIFGPGTTKNMLKRKHQETKDGKRYWDAGPHSEEMQKLNQNFMILHSVSSVFNVVELGVTVWYGLILAGKFVA